MPVRLAVVALLLVLAGLARSQAADPVRVYRCVAANGQVSLRDTPCPPQQTQQVRDLTRPQDPPSRPPLPAPKQATPATPPPAPPATRVVYVTPPQPMYECTTEDGERYTSDDDDGNPRWVPYWTLGYPAGHGRPIPDASRGAFRPAPPLGTPPAGATVRHGPAQPPPPTSPSNGVRTRWPLAVAGGTWVRDTCVMLPPREACARLRDRRRAIGTRFFNAQPSERERLRREERSLNARLDNDCGGR